MGGGSYRLRTIRKTALIFLLIITLISVILINKSEAKYQVGKVYEDIVSGNVKNNVADFNLVSIYINGEKTLDNKVPESGYVLDLKNTKCTLNGEELSDITFEYKYGKVGVYGINASKTKCNIYFVDSPMKKIKDSSLGKLDASHFSKTSCLKGTNSDAHSESDCDEETNGIYEEKTNLGTTYYYRGSVNNNWVKFGKTGSNKGEGTDIWWRIIRINEDGTIRLIYAGEGNGAPASDENGYWMSNSYGINDEAYSFNNSSDYNAYVGYMYGKANSQTFNAEHGYDLIDSGEVDKLQDSNVKDVIDDWYFKNLQDEGNVLSGSTGFCGDRGLDPNYEGNGYANLVSRYRARYRIVSNKNPSFECEDSAHDLYTTKDEKGQGNGALDYPVGLITIDEASYAGGLAWVNSGVTNANYGYWLRTGKPFWSLSPSSNNGGSNASVLVVYDAGYLGGIIIVNLYGIRPTINVLPDYFNTEGHDGTIDNPYVVEI